MSKYHIHSLPTWAKWDSLSTEIPKSFIAMLPESAQGQFHYDIQMLKRSGYRFKADVFHPGDPGEGENDDTLTAYCRKMAYKDLAEDEKPPDVLHHIVVFCRSWFPDHDFYTPDNPPGAVLDWIEEQIRQMEIPEDFFPGLDEELRQLKWATLHVDKFAEMPTEEELEQFGRSLNRILEPMGLNDENADPKQDFATFLRGFNMGLEQRRLDELKEDSPSDEEV